MTSHAWPELELSSWQETATTLHMIAQVVGKIRTARAPPLPHWGHAALSLSARGLSTGPLPDPCGAFEIEIDLVAEELRIASSWGDGRRVPLPARPVAEMYGEAMASLDALGIDVEIRPIPVEVDDPIPFPDDVALRRWDIGAARRFHQILLSTAHVMDRWRGDFVGKQTAPQFWWGGFDLACSRFSGRRAPTRIDPLEREAYSHELFSVGFWPGSGAVHEAAFYAYAVPHPSGYADAARGIDGAHWEPSYHQHILPYATLRASPAPDDALLAFFRATYEAAATLSEWDRFTLERGAPSARRAMEARALL